MSELEQNFSSDTTLLISWGEPVSPNGNILSYSITITDLRDDSTVRSENRGTEESTSFMLTNLGKLFITSILSLQVDQYMSLYFISIVTHTVCFVPQNLVCPIM